MLVGDRTIVFLVGKSKLCVSKIECVVRDFYESKKEEGRVFSFYELRELVKMKNVDYFLEGFMFNEVLPYAVPFFEKESLKTWEGVEGYG